MAEAARRDAALSIVRSGCDNLRPMAQKTLVLKLAPKEQTALEGNLSQGAFEHRSVPHARLSVKGEGVVATLYSSGKLVVQGADPEAFTERFVGRSDPAGRKKTSSSAKKSTGALVPTGRVIVGSDEAGKGDYFGPLVVCALRLPPEHRDGVARSDVTDSKKLTDEQALRMAPVLRESFACSVQVLDPPRYNEVHAREKNLNPMLADLHAAAIREIAEEGDVVLVDRFAREELVASRLRGLPIDLVQAPRAEKEPAVAAASVIARAEFLLRLRELSEEFAVDLHKGAGAPTDKAGKRFLAIHGVEKLGAVAKLHFKNTRKIGAR